MLQNTFRTVFFLMCNFILFFSSFVIGANSVKIVNLDAYDLAYDPFSQRIYATVPSTSASHGNSIAIINPTTGVIEGSVFVGSDPRKIALSADGIYIYVGLYGAGSVSRFHIPSKTVDKTFSLGTGSYGTTYVEDLDVQPGNPKVIAVSRYRKGISPRHDGVAIYDDGVMRPQKTADHTGSNVIEFSDSPNILYGYCNETTGFAVYKNIVSEYGVAIGSTYSGLIGSFSVDFEYDNDFLYTTNGRVINTQTMQLAGQFGVSGKLEPDSTVRRTFYIDGTTLKSFNQTSFLQDGLYAVPGVSGSAQNLIRWGAKGLAFSTTGKQIVIVETDIVPNPPTITSLVIEGPAHLPGYKGQYKLFATFSDGVTLDVTQKSRWSTDPNTYTSIDNAGTLYVFGTDQAGATTINTNYMFAGVLYTASKNITFDGVIPAVGNLVRLEIDGPRQVLQDSSVQMTATAFFDDNTQYNVTTKVQWRLSNTEIATIDSAGLLTIGQIVRPRDLVLYASFGYKDVELETNKTVIVLQDASQMSSSDWPMFQGNPQHTGYAPVVLDTEDFSLRWTKIIAGGKALNPVAATGGRVFVSVPYYFVNAASFFALDARDSETLWSKNLGSVYSINPPSYAYGNVYIQTGKGTSSPPAYVSAFDAGTGQMVFQSGYSAQWERHSAPTIYDGSVYVNGGYYGGMYNYNAFSGAQKWFRSLAQVDGWTPAVSGDYSYAYLGGTLIAIDRHYGTQAFTIKAGSASTNQVPVIGNLNNALVINGKSLVSLDLAEKKVRWEFAGNFSGIPSVDAGVVYAVNGNGLDARSETTGELLWSWMPPEGALKSPMIVTQTHVIACTAANTYAIEILGRQSDWSYPASGHLALGNDTLYIAAANGVLTAIATPEYIPAQPVKLEIEGPNEVFESSTNTYQATVTYSDGRVRNRTALCIWTVTETPQCVFDEGTLSTGEMLYPQETVTLSAEYSQGATTVTDTMPIVIRANCTAEQLMARNLGKALQAKDKVQYELQQAMMYEKASHDIAQQLLSKNNSLSKGQAENKTGNPRVDLTASRNNINHAIMLERLAVRVIQFSIQDLTSALKLLTPPVAAPEIVQEPKTIREQPKK